jgi:hypothetical protein
MLSSAQTQHEQIFLKFKKLERAYAESRGGLNKLTSRLAQFGAKFLEVENSCDLLISENRALKKKQSGLASLEKDNAMALQEIQMLKGHLQDSNQHLQKSQEQCEILLHNISDARKVFTVM